MKYYSCSQFGAASLRATDLKHFEVDLHPRYFVCHCTTAPLTRIVQTLTVTSVSCLICVIASVNIIKKTCFGEQHGNICFCYSKLTIWTRLPFMTGFFYSYFQTSWNIEAFLLCVFTSTKSLRGPPWNKGHRPKVRHETSVLEVPAQEQHEHSFYSSSTNTFIRCSLYTARRYRTSPGAPDLRARLG